MLFAVLLAVQTVTLRRVRTEARRAASSPTGGGFLVAGPAELIPLQAGMISMAEFRERMAMVLSPLPPLPAPRSAWDVSMTLSPAGLWNDVCHYDDASRKPDEIANGVTANPHRPAEGRPGRTVVVSRAEPLSAIGPA